MAQPDANKAGSAEFRQRRGVEPPSVDASPEVIDKPDGVSMVLPSKGGVVIPKHLLLVLFAWGGLFGALNPVIAQTWTQTGLSVTNIFWTRIAASANGCQIVVAGLTTEFPYYGPIYISSDSGVTWVSNTVPPSGWGGIASSADGTNMVLVTSAGTIYSSTNSKTFAYKSTIPQDLSGLASSADGAKLVVGGFPGSIYVSTNSGGTWSPSPGTSGKHWTSIAASADGSKVVAASFDGSVFTSTDSGNTWATNNLPRLFWVSVASSADGNILAVAPGGFNSGHGPIFVSTNSGGTWSTNNSPMLAWQSIASSADGTRLVAAALTIGGYEPFSNSIYTSTDFGVTWVSNNVAAEDWSAVASSADGNMLVATTTSGAGNHTYGGVWASQSTPSPRLNIVPSSNNIALAWIIPLTNFVLQQNLDLTTTNWTVVTNPPTLNLTNLQYQVSLSPSNSSGFYRLASP